MRRFRMLFWQKDPLFCVIQLVPGRLGVRSLTLLIVVAGTLDIAGKVSLQTHPVLYRPVM